jgi:hypothetical protein
MGHGAMEDVGIEKLLKSIPAGAQNEHMAAAQSIWRALDDMAENEPEQYQHFIKQQMNNAKEFAPKLPARRPGIILTASCSTTASDEAPCSPPTVDGHPWSVGCGQLASMMISFKVGWTSTMCQQQRPCALRRDLAFYIGASFRCAGQERTLQCLCARWQLQTCVRVRRTQFCDQASV